MNTEVCRRGKFCFALPSTKELNENSKKYFSSQPCRKLDLWKLLPSLLP